MLPDFLCRPLIMVFGILYPGYMSYKVLKTKRSTNYGIWLMYWVTFSMFTSAETVTDIFIGPWLPFYNEVKLFLLYMTYPTSDSSLTYVYKNIISPFIKRHEKDIDKQINHFKRGGLQTLMSTGKKCTDMMMTMIFKVLQNNGFPVGHFINHSMHLHTNVNPTLTIEQTDGNGILWDETMDSSENEETLEEALKPLPQDEERDYSFSDMYTTRQDENPVVVQGPPSSNTRRRKKTR
ncbi:receptor expression-enhancing protein 4-like isoform X2 [Adelges cooleyi]|uniref:receptor expression-enhancing protein 4-like isoform X2 n=1 Tax=Adelges cooleyi TaxID=133065 RepID=UPI00217FF771|nr:receptor expression-enhancing protein 4-like isoform X2 [Adelges cooleyi]